MASQARGSTVGCVQLLAYDSTGASHVAMPEATLSSPTAPAAGQWFADMPIKVQSVKPEPSTNAGHLGQ